MDEDTMLKIFENYTRKKAIKRMCDNIDSIILQMHINNEKLKNDR